MIKIHCKKQYETQTYRSPATRGHWFSRRILADMFSKHCEYHEKQSCVFLGVATGAVAFLFQCVSMPGWGWPGVLDAAPGRRSLPSIRSLQSCGGQGGPVADVTLHLRDTVPLARGRPFEGILDNLGQLGKTQWVALGWVWNVSSGG